MRPDASRVRQCLQNFDFRTLFIQELGWDKHTGHLPVVVDDRTYHLDAIAEKRGFQVFECPASDSGVPDYLTRGFIERKVAKFAHEHIIIYLDANKHLQKWQWVRRELGRPLARREYDFAKGQTGELLVQKLQYLAVGLSEEEGLTLIDVTRRARQAFDVDRITKRFYDRFKAEHAIFLKFVKGITAVGDCEWYASLMLNRLMFIYFIQKKGFLDNDLDYLRHRLRMMQQRNGKDKFLTFYRYFLLRLFHEGLGQPPSLRRKDLDDLLGQVPYMNGGLFEVHELEKNYPTIQIADEAFERLFDFFDAYGWHLDERPLRSDNEINPDVLGYIFEKYINQKQMGAYYTKEDITGYIGRNTIIPFLFETAQKEYARAFEPDSAVWHLLGEDPDRYLYEPVRRGVIDEHGAVIPESALPDFVQQGMHDPGRRMFDDSYNLGEAALREVAGTKLALATETWREYVERRNRCLELRNKLQSGGIQDIKDLVTHNVDICQFAEDVIENCEGPELLRVLYNAIAKISVLDPTCGSGAFLFAALNILEPLYDACLERMLSFLEDHEWSDEKHNEGQLSDFHKILKEVARHPNRRHFILKSIIINNLYGVDIMEEAVEICKLRLFLKLMAEVDKVDQLEPLPDIDFNIRCGNTLVGFASLDEVKKRLEGTLGFDQQKVVRIIEEADGVDHVFQEFREMQTEYGMDATRFVQAKAELRRRLGSLRADMDGYLAGEYGVDTKNPKALQQWRTTQQSFHWLAEFYGIMNDGGFDVIIGNPPYVTYTPAKVPYTILTNSYHSFETKNLYAYVYERSLALGKTSSRIGFIVQLTFLSAERLDSLQNILLKRGQFNAIPFPRRPESIFDGVEMPVAIVLAYSSPEHVVHTSRVSRFYTEERSDALRTVRLVTHNIRRNEHRIAKIGSMLEAGISSKLDEHPATLGTLTNRTSIDHLMYYQEACRYWTKACVGVPFFKRNRRRVDPPHGRTLAFGSRDAASFAACIANSSLFYWFYSVFSDCEHINDALLRGFPIPERWHESDWVSLYDELSDDLKANATRKVMMTKQGHKIEYDEIKALLSRRLINEIDRELATHYGFTDEELDFIINYDIKYRMGGQDAEGLDDE